MRPTFSQSYISFFIQQPFLEIFSQTWISIYTKTLEDILRFFFTEMQMRIHKFFEPIVIF